MPLSHKKTRIQAFDRVNGVNGNARNAGIPRRYLFSARASLVAQICNLLYCRIAFCRAMEMPGVPGLWRDSQNAILRYSRLKICATKVGGKTHTLTGVTSVQLAGKMPALPGQSQGARALMTRKNF